MPSKSKSSKASSQSSSEDAGVKSPILESLANNVTHWQEEAVKLTVRSLDAKYANMTFVKRKGDTIQLECNYLELDIQNSESEGAEWKIQLNDKNVVPHTTLVLPIDTATVLLNQLASVLTPQPQQ